MTSPTAARPPLPADLDLTGRAALVTGCGSASGIGFATARALAERGARVVMTATTDRIEERVAELAALGLAAHGVVARLETEQGATRAVAAAVDAVGELSILVNNAGMVAVGEEMPRGDIGMSVDEWRSAVDVNLTSVFLVTRAVVPAMREAGWGRIVTVASTTSNWPVMYEAPGDASHAIAEAISSGRPLRPSGTSSPSCASCGSCDPVAIHPGATALTVMPLRASSIASPRVNPSTPAFAVA